MSERGEIAESTEVAERSGRGGFLNQKAIFSYTAIPPLWFSLAVVVIMGSILGAGHRNNNARAGYIGGAVVGAVLGAMLVHTQVHHVGWGPSSIPMRAE